MPWECRGCGAADHADDLATCPACGAAKASWTVVADRTRTFQVTARAERARILRGEESSPLEPGGPGYEAATWVAATEAVALTKRRAADLAAAGLLPPPAQVLAVRLEPRSTDRDRSVTLSPELPARATIEVRFEPPAEPGPDGAFELRFVLVYGEGDVPQLSGLHVVDVGDGTSAVVAERLGVRALSKKRQVLPVRASGARAFILVEPGGAGELRERRLELGA